MMLQYMDAHFFFLTHTLNSIFLRVPNTIQPQLLKAPYWLSAPLHCLDSGITSQINYVDPNLCFRFCLGENANYDNTILRKIHIEVVLCTSVQKV